MARTIRRKVYKFSELAETAKQKAIEDYRNSNTEIFWADENRETMEKFADIFPIKVTSWSYGDRGEGVNFHFTSDEGAIEELSGQRLATYIWNNYRNDLFKGKYMGDPEVKHCIDHNRIKCIDHKNGNFTNAYHSAITLDTSCVLTGYYMDDVILSPVYEHLKRPSSDTTFRDLLEYCFDAWIKACNEDVEHQNSDEYIGELLESNEYEYTADGRQFN